jgi:hypothetical protein
MHMTLHTPCTACGRCAAGRGATTTTGRFCTDLSGCTRVQGLHNKPLLTCITRLCPYPLCVHMPYTLSIGRASVVDDPTTDTFT